MIHSLVQKYNVPGPRYTSYPTVPYWNEKKFDIRTYLGGLKKAFEVTNPKEGISLYIHLPFCESLCTFCGCNKRITKRHEVESPYIAAVLEEWRLYCSYLGSKPRIREIHLGGGTPTFFSPCNLELLVKGILDYGVKMSDADFSFEGHPNNTTEEHLQVLYGQGFRRLSYGVQDYNLEVQKAIHRIQPFENVKRATESARNIGYTSVGHDIIFGLPFQTLEHVQNTIEKTKILRPDRIAFYSYAHVPWIKGNGQRGFKEEDLPKPQLKREMYETGKRQLEEAGYVEIGMDHFALKSDSLYQAVEARELHRNFMGYTTSSTKVMIGLGVSAIGDSWTGFAQNVKSLEDYYEKLEGEEFPLFRGHLLTEEDLILRRHILNIMCKLETSWENRKDYFPELGQVLENLEEMVSDQIVELQGSKLVVREQGRGFVRNVCMAFDLHLMRTRPDAQLFSMTV